MTKPSSRTPIAELVPLCRSVSSVGIHSHCRRPDLPQLDDPATAWCGLRRAMTWPTVCDGAGVLGRDTARERRHGMRGLRAQAERLESVSGIMPAWIITYTPHALIV